MKITRIVDEAHQSAKGSFEEEYQRKFKQYLTPTIQEEFNTSWSQKQIEQFEKGIWEMEKNWSRYEGRRIKLGKFLKLTVEYVLKFLRDTK